MSNTSNKPKPYEGPFAFPPADIPDGAIGWRHVSKPVEGNPSMWEPDGWTIIYPDYILVLDKHGYGVRESVLHAMPDENDGWGPKDYRS